MEQNGTETSPHFVTRAANCAFMTFAFVIRAPPQNLSLRMYRNARRPTLRFWTVGRLSLMDCLQPWRISALCLSGRSGRRLKARRARTSTLAQRPCLSGGRRRAVQWGQPSSSAGEKTSIGSCHEDWFGLHYTVLSFAFALVSTVMG